MSSGTVYISSVGEGRERVRRPYGNGKSQAAGLRLDDDFLPPNLRRNIEILNAPKNGHYPTTRFLPYFRVKKGGYPQKAFPKGLDVIDEDSKSWFWRIPPLPDDWEMARKRIRGSFQVDMSLCRTNGREKRLRAKGMKSRQVSVEQTGQVEEGHQERKAGAVEHPLGFCNGFRDVLRDGSQGPEMVVIPPGCFDMGDIWGDGYASETPVHAVHISRSFALGRYQVTFEEYQICAMATDRALPFDNDWGRGRRPVILIAWHEAVAYAEWLSEQTGKRYRLPSEAEWEYAARSGGANEKWAGFSDESELADHAWCKENSSSTSHPVGEKKLNGLGLYDMSGNVWEWVQDRWHDTYEGAPDDGSAWETGDEELRVLRGGSWYSVPWNVRSSIRLRSLADARGSDIGLRVARDVGR